MVYLLMMPSVDLGSRGLGGWPPPFVKQIEVVYCEYCSRNEEKYPVQVPQHYFYVVALLIFEM